MTICEYHEDSNDKVIRMQVYKEAVVQLRSSSERAEKTEKLNASCEQTED